MIESIIVSIIASASYDALKEFTKLSLEDIKSRVINIFSKNNSDNIDHSQDNEANIKFIDELLLHTPFNNAVNIFLQKKDFEPIQEYFEDNNLSEEERNKISELLLFANNMFDKFVFKEAESIENQEFINYSVEHLIPNKIESLYSLQNKVEIDNLLLYKQLKALLDNQKEIFEEEKSLYGKSGINPRITTEIIRLEDEIYKLIDGRSN